MLALALIEVHPKLNPLFVAVSHSPNCFRPFRGVPKFIQEVCAHGLTTSILCNAPTSRASGPIVFARLSRFPCLASPTIVLASFFEKVKL